MAKEVRFKLRRDSASDWASKNPILLEGEPAVEMDTKLTKVGDGVTPWNQLAYSIPTATIQAMVNAAITAAGGVPTGGGSDDDGTSFLLLYQNAKV